MDTGTEQTVTDLFTMAEGTGLHFTIRHVPDKAQYLVIVDEFRAEGPSLKEALLAAFAAARARLERTANEAEMLAAANRQMLARLDAAMPSLRQLQIEVTEGAAELL